MHELLNAISAEITFRSNFHNNDYNLCNNMLRKSKIS